MKRLFLLALPILILLIIASPVYADEIIPTWPADGAANTITLTSESDSTFHYTPQTSGEYAVIFKNHTPTRFDVTIGGPGPSGEEVMSDFEWENTTTNDKYIIFTFDAGTQYTFNFRYWDVFNEYGGQHTFTASIVPWEDSLAIPTYEEIQLGERTTLTMQPDNIVYYSFTAPETGKYTIGRTYRYVWMSLSAMPTGPDTYGHDPGRGSEWEGVNELGAVYYLEAGNTYVLKLEQYGTEDAVTTEIWIDKGETYKNFWEFGKPLSLTLNDETGAIYYTTPAESGRYMIAIEQLGFGIEIEGVTGTEFSVYPYDGYIYELTGGTEYKVRITARFHGRESISGTFQFEKAGPVVDAELYIYYYGLSWPDNKLLYVELQFETDPLCGYLDGVTWSVSDPSIMETESFSDNTGVIRVNFLKKGEAVVTARVGNIKREIKLSSNMKCPALKEGQPKKLYAYGTAGTFTPSASGTYRFTVDPEFLTDISILDPNENPVFNKTGISKKDVFTVNLSAGVCYELYLMPGMLTVTVEAVKTEPPATQPPVVETAPPTVATEPLAPETEPPTVGTLPPATETTPPTVATDPTATTVPTEPTETTVPETTPPTVPTEPATEPTESTPFENSIVIDGNTAYVSDDALDDILTNATSNDVSLPMDAAGVSQVLIDINVLRVLAEQEFDLEIPFNNIKLILNADTLLYASEEMTNQELSVELKEVRQSELNEAQQNTLRKYNVETVFSVSMSCGEHQFTSLGNGTAEFKLPLESMYGTNLQAIYLANDGSIEKMDTVTDDCVKFSTNHFSVYALVSETTSSSVDGDTNQINPWIIVIPAVIVLAAGLAGYILIQKRKK